MTIEEVFDALRRTDAVLYVEGARLKYAGPRLTPDDPLRAGIAEHRAVLLELFTYAPGGRCVVDGCYRLRAPNEATCPDHHRESDATPDACEQSETLKATP